MKTENKYAAILLCSVAVAALSGTANARPTHMLRHYGPAVAMPAMPTNSAPEADQGHVLPRQAGAQGHGQQQQIEQPQRPHVSASQAHAAAAEATSGSFFGGFGGDLISEARRYLGTNPTNRSTLWCGAFVDVVLQKTGHKPGSALAAAYLNYGPRVSGPQPGAIAIFNGGSHVGIVSGVDSNGNPIIISGNVNRTTTEQAFARNRITAYVMPGG